MRKERSVKQRLISAVLVLVMLFSSLLGTTFAWFTDQVSSAGNQIVSGTLKVDLSVKGENDEWVSLKQNPDQPIFDYKHWEPGYTRVEQLKVDNLGTLALKYQLSIEVAPDTADIGENGAKLSDVIDVYIADGEETAESFADITEANGWTHKGTLTQVMEKPSEFVKGQLKPDGQANDSQIVTIALHMQESAGNEYQDLSAGDIFVNLIATQESDESDSFGPDYDDKAEFPEIDIDDLSIEVEVEGGFVKTEKSASRAGVSITVPAGVKVDGVTDGTATLVLSVDEKEKSDANVTLSDDEILRPLDVHVEGVADDNQTALVITIEKAMPIGLNIGNYTLYHVEDDATNVMTSVDADGVDAHNEFYYAPATGDTTLAMATFSEVAVVADTVNAWNGEFDYGWYNADATELVIANADQLAAFGAIVGGMAKDESGNFLITYTDSDGDEHHNDSFSDKTIKLLADINLGDDEENNVEGKIFYPIGYWNNEGTYEKTGTAISSGFYAFEGTFDGNGHTIANFYQNTWEMKGDHNWYDATLQYYRDGMGLFGKVYRGTVKNLTVENFTSDGEITTTGVIAAYADGATFENIAIFNCNPRVYNIGNGGIVGCVGWYAKEAGLKTTFKNITVDNSNKISALWGSYDVACGGIVGQYYPTSGQTSAGTPKNGGIEFTNCHVAAQMDVYNDVCANYQYYAYRYTGMLIGSVRENETIDGHVYPKMDGITASGCTVHFGTWNDYYYCEIIDNTTASYTHDYQMSRLVEIKAIDGTTITYLDGTTGTVPASGRANYVIVDYTKGHGTENATCYHFKDGVVWTHDMGGIQTGVDENGDGQDDLKEDKQHIYLEFNNLVTGYGWGVTSRGFSNLNGVTNLDITTGLEESVEKFEGKVTELSNNKEYKLGDIFSFVDNGVELVPGALAVSVHNLDENNPVSATIKYDRENWENGTITLTGTGKVQITIQDYYFCTPTTITVNVTERQNEEKFDVVMNNGDFLHRVGNQNTVTLGSLFKAKEDASIGTVSVTFENVAGNASGTFTANNSDWTKGTIQFSGTGVVKVTIKDDDTYCTPTVLYLEVVDAVNATGATNATANNVVLLNNCGFSSLEVSGGYALYGNGFTMTCSSDSYATDRTYAFVELKGGTLDNVKIVTPNFSHAILYEGNKTENENPSYTDAAGKTRYYNIRSAVLVSATSKITNSYISGGRAAIYATSGTLTVENSTIYGGAVANIQAEASSSLVLKDVTLIQKPIKANVNDTSKTVMGFSVVTMCGTDGVGTPITLQGYLHQYAWVNSDYAAYVPSDAQDIVTNALKNESFVHKITYEDGVTRDSINLGFAYMPNGTATSAKNMNDERLQSEQEKMPYETTTVDVGISSMAPSIYTYKNTHGTDVSVQTEPSYVANTQGIVLPTIKFEDVNENCVFTTTYDATKAAWKSTLKVDVDAGEYSFSFADLLAQKYGNNLAYTVTTEDGTVVDKNAEITLNSAVSNVYVLTITDNQIYDKNGTLTGETVESTYIFELLATKTSLPAPTWTSTTLKGTPYIVVDTKNSDWNVAVPVLDGLKVIYWSKKQNKEVELDLSTVVSAAGLSVGLQNGSNNTITITVADEYTLTITTTNFKSNDNGKPVVVNGKLYFTVSSSSNYVSTSTTSRAPNISYSFTDANNSEPITHSTSFTVTYADYKSNQYKYSDFCNGTLTDASSCITGDTLITLADGTQKRIDQVNYDDQLLAWNMFTGTYVSVPASYIVFHGNDHYSVISLEFSDGNIVKIIGDHGFFDADLNQYVFLNEENVNSYMGHSFVKQDGDGHTIVALTGYSVNEEFTGSYSIASVACNNVLANGMLSVTPVENIDSEAFFNFLAMGDDMQYDERALQKDIETYGLFVYDDLSEYMTESEFKAFVASNGHYLKIAVGKGIVTLDEILAMMSPTDMVN
ncbi:MAG: hypothetical protein IJW70_04645 [Clostridia bacterium]|nr:hypothetical protein [Clostridia bacterium]